MVTQGMKQWLPCGRRMEGYPVLCHSVDEPVRQRHSDVNVNGVLFTSLGLTWLALESSSPPFGWQRWCFKRGSLFLTVPECSGIFTLTPQRCLLWCPHCAMTLVLCQLLSFSLLYISSHCLALRFNLKPMFSYCNCAHSGVSKLFLRKCVLANLPEI